MTRFEIESILGGLNGREPFIQYLLRKAERLTRDGHGERAIFALMNAECRFWSALLSWEMSRYDAARSEPTRRSRGFILVHFEFDDLFRYCSDPEEYFGIDVFADHDEWVIAELVSRFSAYLSSQRPGPTSTRYPVSAPSFLITGCLSVVLSALLDVCSAFFRVRTARQPFWLSVFRETDGDQATGVPEAKRFWGGILLTALLVISVLAATVAAEGMAVAEAGHLDAHDAVGFVVLVALTLVLAPVVLRSLLQIGRVVVALRDGQRSGVARCRTMAQAEEALGRIRGSFSVSESATFGAMVNELYDDHLVSLAERERLLRGDRVVPRTPRAQERLVRWTNVSLMARSTVEMVPSISSWHDVRSVTILVFSLNERFRYTWDKLTSDDLNDVKTATILANLVKAYTCEWENLLADLRHLLTPGELTSLYELRWSTRPCDEVAVAMIEYWANVRLQTLFNTMEGCKKLFSVYERLAAELLPGLDEPKRMALVAEKVQVVLLHDLYPQYPLDSDQKGLIDNYFRDNPQLELRWPTGLVHQSKSGSWAAALPSIRGEFLMTLDADHHVAIEEISNLPHALVEFARDPTLDAIQFRLQTFNEDYCLVARCAGVSEDSWYLLDLRAKGLIGGGGAYGKLIYRVSAIRSKELVQPDSVGEDMLTMARLQCENAGVRFIEYLQIGQGQEVTYTGLKRKYGRYPLGAIESSLSKPFKEMLLSTKTPWHRKADALFMVSYYPIHFLGVIASGAVLASYASGLAVYKSRYLGVFPTVLCYLAIFSDHLMVLGSLWERCGFLCGTTKFLKIIIPMHFMHISFISHYVEQLVRGLGGHARFNATTKSSELTAVPYSVTYRDSRFGCRLGVVYLSLALAGFMRYGFSALDVAALGPFIYNSIAWTIGPFIFIPRRTTWAKIGDVLIAVPYVVSRSIFDALRSLCHLFYDRSFRAMLFLWHGLDLSRPPRRRPSSSL